MDWKKTFSHGQWVIHSIFIIAVISAFGITMYSLRLSQFQATEEERVLKVNSLIHSLKQDQSFEKVGKYLSWAEADKAHDKMRELSAKIAEVEEILSSQASKDLSLGVRTFNRLINSGSGMSNPGDALKVLNQKVNALSDVARSNGFKNIIIISDRMKNRLQQLNAKNAGASAQISFLKSDITRMQQLVNQSSLSEGEKEGLSNRFKSMKDEMDLLGNLNSQARDLKNHVTQSTLALNEWLLEIEKQAEGLKGQQLQKQRNLVMMMAGLVAFMATAWLGLAYLFRWQKARMGEQVEGEVKTVIQKGIIDDQRFMVDHYSETTRDDIVRLLDGLKIKLSLGNLLHEGLPFAGCMVDNTFKLTWHNQLFLEQLYLSEEEVKSDAFNWDYVRDYLNLDEDPIYEAMVNKIAGIYPVKVKQDEFTPSQPFEMYVTPISVNREDRVMVFFYPLISVKEAIAEQVNLTRTSIENFISLWNEERLGEDEIRLLERNFKANDLHSLYENLCSVYGRVNTEKTECLSIIRELEGENSHLLETIEFYRRLDEERLARTKEEVKVAGELRACFISSIERCESLIQINKNVLQQNDDLKNEALKMQNQSQEALKKNRETMDILGHLDGVKTDYKKLKLELLEVKAKLISLNNSLLGQLPPLDETQQKLAMRYKDELARLDFNVTTLDKKLSQLDVLIGKLQMMHERTNMEQVPFNFNTSQKDHELRETLLGMQKSIGVEETRIIGHFKNLHGYLKEDLRRTNLEGPSESLHS